MKCEICQKYLSKFQCEICGKRICGCCVRFVEGLATPKPYYWKPEITLCKACTDKLKLSIIIASLEKRSRNEKKKRII